VDCARHLPQWPLSLRTLPLVLIPALIELRKWFGRLLVGARDALDHHLDNRMRSVFSVSTRNRPGTAPDTIEIRLSTARRTYQVTQPVPLYLVLQQTNVAWPATLPAPCTLDSRPLIVDWLQVSLLHPSASSEIFRPAIPCISATSSKGFRLCPCLPAL
jgi:hypothetical protein